MAKTKITTHDVYKVHKQWRKPLIISSIIVVALAALIGAGWWFYGSHALPNVKVGNIAVGQANANAIKQAVQKQSNFTMTFADGAGHKTTAQLKDLGLQINVDATVQNAMQARRTGPLWQNLAVWQTKEVPLVFTNDPGILKEYIQQHFPSLFVNAIDAQLQYNLATQQFDISPGTTGRGFDIKGFEASLPSLANNPHNVTLTVTSAPVLPIITATGLQAVQKEVNDRLKMPITLTYNGQQIYHANANDIAEWTHFMPDAVKGSASITFDKSIVQQFIQQHITPIVTTPPEDRKVVVDQQTGAQSVIVAGHAGGQLKDQDGLAQSIVDALSGNKPLTKEVSVEQAPFKTVTMAGYGKWIEVDLSQQRLTMYIGNTPVASYLISSGMARTPTEVGEFHIYSKLPLTTMTGTILGEYYYIPNIPWVSYFDGGEAFHGTYWHHNFGHPMSHGCINMTIADAKTLYDFAPVGTKVIVHS
jgi:lipoprotein-anchoring transpeptidase ErfK/SrfK